MTAAVDLFCGAGGASRGLHDAGYDVTGYDHWQPAVDCPPPPSRDPLHERITSARLGLDRNT